MDGLVLQLQSNMRTKLWLPENTRVDSPISLNFGLSGYFTVQVIDAESGHIKQELQFKNLLTDGCLNGIGNDTFTLGIGPSGFTHLAVGTGNSTPSTSNTSLDAEISRTNSNGGIADILGANSTPEYGYVRRTRVFTTAQANGNLRELGFFNASSGGTLLNRALFRDSAGNPTTVTKTSQDVLVVVYEWRLTAPSGDQSGSFSYFNGTQTTSWLLRPQGVNQDTHWVNAVQYIGDWSATANSLAYFSNSTFFNTRTGLNTPATNTGNISLVTPQTYVSNSFQRDVAYRLAVVDGNVAGGIALFVFSPWDSNSVDRRYLYQMSFTPALLKNDVRQIDVTIRYTWQRV